MEVNIIPTTASSTTLGMKRVGDKVNLETDVVGKYIVKNARSRGLTEKNLQDAGFI
jgi:riboflavin synthase